jgi:hypothetical protein
LFAVAFAVAVVLFVVIPEGDLRSPLPLSLLDFVVILNAVKDPRISLISQGAATTEAL